jgi:hypothetical protein
MWRTVVSARVSFSFLQVFLLLCASSLPRAAPLTMLLPQPAWNVFSQGTINTIAPQADGKLWLGGQFAFYNGLPAQNLVRVNLDGSLDISISAQCANSSVLASLSLRDTDRIWFGGRFNQFCGQSRFGLAAISQSTGMVSPITVDVNNGGYVSTLASDGKWMYAGGGYTSLAGQPRAGLGRFNPDTGAADATWKPAMPNTFAIPYAIAPSGNWVYIGGSFPSVSGVAFQNLVRVDATTGAVDQTFNPAPDGPVHTLLTDLPNQLVVGGGFTKIFGQASPGIAVLNLQTGTLAPGFKSPLTLATGGSVYTLFANGNNLIAGGSFNLADGSAASLVSLDATTGNLLGTSDPVNGPVYAGALWPGFRYGRSIVAGGSFNRTGAINAAIQDGLRSLAVYTEALSRVRISAGVSSPGVVNAVTPLSDGSTAVAGNFIEVNGIFVHNIAIMNSDGTFNRTWNAGPDFPVQAMAGDDTFLYAASSSGTSTTGPGSSPPPLVRMHRGTQLITPFVDPNLFFPNRVRIRNSQLYVGAGSSAATRRLFAIDTGSWTVNNSFAPSVDGAVVDMAFDANGNLLAVGGFQHVGQFLRPGAALVNATDGTPLSAFNANLTLNGNTQGFSGTSVAVDGSNAYLGGGFNQVGGQPRIGIASVNAGSGQLNTGFVSGSTVAVQKIGVFGNAVYLGIPGTTFAGQAAHGVVVVDKATGQFLQDGDVTLFGGQSGTVSAIEAIYSAKAASPSHSADASTPDSLIIAGQFDMVAGQPRSAIAALGTPGVQVVKVVGFHDPNRNHFFRTANPEEAAALTANPSQGFLHNGDDFNAWSRAAYPAGAVPFDRFYGSVTPGPNSHFYTGIPAESAALKQLQYIQPDDLPRWNFEETAFAAYVPDAQGNCPAAAPVPVYRAFNNRAAQADSNHLLTTNASLYNQTVASGWNAEGKVACVPQ